ncbi:MAG: energy transducer TonB [Bacteroidales bacterium]|jgi:protein TonB|nr:energy transducer TonB [Bacteroidales bacterium]
MKTKKAFKADLESKKGLFLKIGFIVTLSIVYMAFQIKSYEAPSFMEFDVKNVDIEIISLLITKPERPIPPKPPKADPILFDIVNNDDDVLDDIEIDVEIGTSDPIEIWLPVELPQEDIIDDIIVQFPEQNPEYPGGDAARLAFLKNNIKYPRLAREVGIQGTVYVSFVVEKDGSISNASIVRGIGGGCDEEAARVTQMMPKWIPGKQGKYPVRVKYYMPVKFTLAK